MLQIKTDDLMWDINKLQELQEYIGDSEEYEPSPEELDGMFAHLEKASQRDIYEEVIDNYIESHITPVYCNIISAMTCYMRGEFTKEQLIEDIKRSTDNNKHVIEHIKTIL